MRRSIVLAALCAAALIAAPAAGAHDRPGGGASVGTVSAFTDGALTVTTTDGATVTGRVDARTGIVCIPSGWDKRGDRAHHRKGRSARAGHRRHRGGPRGDRGHHRGHHRPFRCDSAALTAGTVVRAADLRVTASGLVFDDIALVKERSAG